MSKTKSVGFSSEKHWSCTGIHSYGWAIWYAKYTKLTCSKDLNVRILNLKF